MAGTLILGGGGMVGQKLAASLAGQSLPDQGDVTLFDMAFPPASAPGSQVVGNIIDASIWPNLLANRPATIFHLASIVSGEAEADYDKGWQTNMLPFWTFLEAIRAEQAKGGDWRPRIVFTSSIAVFGAPFPDKIGDTFLSAPQTSYGSQKAVCELMLNDLSRKGAVDGVSIRLPTICVRPGKPNKAASGFFSGIIREPLNGQPAILPVSTDVRHWHASPRSAVRYLRQAATMDLNDLQERRALSMPGLSCTVEEQIEALRTVAGQNAVDLIRHEPDETIISIVKNWPRNFDPVRAIELGFKSEETFRDIIDIYLEDDLPKT